MAYTFDAATQRIILSSGTTSLDVRDMYSRWKQWMQTSDNSKYLPAFTATGGDMIDASAGTSIPCYAFLLNGWRVRPQEASHTLSVAGGVLLVSGGGDPFVNTIGSFIVRINYSQPVQAITVNTGGSNPIFDEVMEAGYTFKEIIRLLAAHAAGSAANLEGASPSFTGLDGTTTRITATYSAGTRTITSLDGA